MGSCHDGEGLGMGWHESAVVAVVVYGDMDLALSAYCWVDGWALDCRLRGGSLINPPSLSELERLSQECLLHEE